MKPLRIALWSRPRDISRPRMLSRGSRSDTFVSNEPLSADDLPRTCLPHHRAGELIRFLAPARPRPTAGIWAPPWYGAVERTTAFQSYAPKSDSVPVRLTGLLRECEALYGKLYEQRLACCVFHSRRPGYDAQ